MWRLWTECWKSFAKEEQKEVLGLEDMQLGLSREETGVVAGEVVDDRVVRWQEDTKEDLQAAVLKPRLVDHARGGCLGL